MSTLATVILAAGLGTRMRSNRTKVLHRVAGRPMIEYPITLAESLGSERVICVLGHQADAVRFAVENRFGPGKIDHVLQHEQRGTGHAVQQAVPLLADRSGLLLILYGDVPLLTGPTLQRLVDTASKGILAMVTFTPPSPKGYGRVVRDEAGKVVRIVEDRDCSEAERRIGECNAGIYCGPSRFIVESVGGLTPDNAQGELYLTDIVEAAAHELAVGTIEAPPEEVMGINDRGELARADAIMRRRIAERLMRDGVTVRDPERLFVEPEVLVGRDTELGPGVELRGRTIIGEGCRIEAGVIISDCAIGNNVHIKPYCVLSESQVADECIVGPWAHVRPGSVLENEVHIGNFVETKKTRVGRGSKANHLTYLGDADIGEKVNVGCGTITCNYDGYDKHRTVIEDGVFIGSDTQLVAPVTVGKGAWVGAGTTVHEDVPPGALALSRAPQIAVPGYAERKRALMQAKGESSKTTAAPNGKTAAAVTKKKAVAKPAPARAAKQPKKADKGRKPRRGRA
jgi:bifunctional UDP-N-acetylglucosamine pyrophosphorylase/glucosamine-1-phosphate N-acetyltransferase